MKTNTYKPRNDSDRLNQNFLYQTTHDDLLVAIVNGQIDPKELAKQELQARGLDKNGHFIGFKRAKV